MDSIHAKHGRGIHPARKRAVVGCCRHPSGRNAEGFVKCCTMYFVSLISARDSYFSVVLRPNKAVLGMRTATLYRNLSSDSYAGWDWELKEWQLKKHPFGLNHSVFGMSPPSNHAKCDNDIIHTNHHAN